MRKFYKKGGEVFEFASDGSQDHLITDLHMQMTTEEINRHINPQDYMSEAAKLVYKRSQYPELIRYQFMRGMLENGYKSSDIEAQIMFIEDEYTRELTMLGFKEATNFVRTNESIIAMQTILGLSDEKLDELWEYALAL